MNTVRLNVFGNIQRHVYIFEILDRKSTVAHLPLVWVPTAVVAVAVAVAERATKT